MNILDENILNSQRHMLRGWRIRVHQIGHEVGRKGMKDEEIIPFLHKTRHATFFTRDLGFFDHKLCHAGYCLVCLDVGKEEAASFIRRFLRHPATGTKTNRMGNVVRVSHTGMRTWKLHADKEEKFPWLDRSH